MTRAPRTQNNIWAVHPEPQLIPVSVEGINHFLDRRIQVYWGIHPETLPIQSEIWRYGIRQGFHNQCNVPRVSLLYILDGRVR